MKLLKTLLITLVFSTLTFALSGKNLVYFNYIRYNNPKISDSEIHFIMKEVYAQSNKYKINRDLIFAIMKVESDFKYNTLSNKNAYGYMQITPQLQEDLKLDRYNRKHNIEMGVRYLSIIKEHFGYSNNMIASYNRGLYGVKAKGYQNVKETREYVVKVNKELRILRNETEYVKKLKN